MISKIPHTVLLLILFSCFLGCSTQKVSKSNTPPNIIIVFIDDMGWADVGFNGGTHVKTPRLDQMAKEGMKGFQEFMVKPDREKQIRKRIEKVRKRIYKK